MDVLVLGGAGQVGTELQALAWPAGVAVHAPSRADLDITDPVDGISGIHGVRHSRPSGEIVLERLVPNVATLTQPEQPDHDISLPRRSLRDCLAEELRRLDPDDLFGEVVQNGLGALRTPATAKKRSRSKA